jgi:predicted nuclease of restriction endonuclease-like (RecB) superfamily
MTNHGDLENPQNQPLLEELRDLIEQAKQQAAMAVNASMTQLYWQIGKRLNIELLKEKRADYGKQILATVSQQLTQEYGSGFSYSALTRMIAFSECFPEQEIVATLSQQLSWSHIRELLPLDKPLQRDFYIAMCQTERWSVRTLRKKIDSLLYERTSTSKQPDQVARAELAALEQSEQLSPNLVLKDPYLLDFIGLNDRYLEKDLEDAILRDMENFLLELGGGFAFLSRQKRIMMAHQDYYLDLLFYHRQLKRLIAIDLKVGEFKPEFKGQMEFYLRWLDKHERQKDELPPLGIILCTGKDQETIELLELDKAEIHVAEYLTVLPPKDVLQQRLHQSIEESRQRLLLDNSQDEQN